jgi:hypothetical protein
LGALLAGFLYNWLEGDEPAAVIETVEEVVVVES